MAEVPANAMPSPEGTDSEVVNTQPKAASEGAKTQEVQPKATEAARPEPTHKGEKTPEERQHAAFLEERRMRKEAEIRAAELEAQLNQAKASALSINEEDLSEEGVVLSKEIKSLKSEVVSLREEKAKDLLVASHPALKDNMAEFEEFRSGYPGVDMDKLAKLFLVEKGLTVGEPQRKGLERPSGGAKTAPGQSLSEADVKRIRETEPRKYIKMLRDGKLNPDDIK